jgi:hypothetical protein
VREKARQRRRIDGSAASCGQHVERKMVKARKKVAAAKRPFSRIPNRDWLRIEAQNPRLAQSGKLYVKALVGIDPIHR